MNAATGWDVSPDELHATFERGVTMARLFNLREGMTAADDRLPDRLHEALLHGPLRDRKLSRTQIAAEVRAYYGDHGWDAVTGQPFADTIEHLGLSAVAAAAHAQELIAKRPEPLPAGSLPYATEPESTGAPAE